MTKTHQTCDRYSIARTNLWFVVQRTDIKVKKPKKNNNSL